MASLQNPKFLYFMLLTVQRRWSQSCTYSVLLCGLFYGALHVQSCIVLRSRTFFSHFSIVITLLGEERAALNLNIHTSYFSHVWTIRTNTACEEFARIRHRFQTHLSHTCDIYVLYQFYRWHECKFFTLLEIPLKKLPFCYVRIFHVYFIIFLITL